MAAQTACRPGEDHVEAVGPAGEGYWRIALVPTEDECRRAAEILEAVL